MSGKVLILGNGISRRQPSVLAVIDSWDGELWGCNRVFLDYGMRLARLTGHAEVLVEAQAWKDAHGSAFEIWGGNLGAIKADWHEFACPVALRKDSGTTLVAQALEEQRPEIVCAGFDLGGFDLCSPGADKQDKSVWVDRWRTLAKVYPGLPGLRFLGHDHRPFILSAEPRRTYSKRYLDGKPHIADREYVEVFESFKAASA